MWSRCGFKFPSLHLCSFGTYWSFTFSNPLSWLGLEWVQTLSREHWTWGGDTPWMEHQSNTGHHTHTHSLLCMFWEVAGNGRTRGNPCGHWKNMDFTQTVTWVLYWTEDLILWHSNTTDCSTVPTWVNSYHM